MCNLFQHANTKICITNAKKPKPNDDSLVFGQSMSDHMLLLEWNSKSGWSDPLIKPYGNLLLDPSSSVFHYGSEVSIYLCHLHIIPLHFV